jgi:hypothetical protein
LVIITQLFNKHFRKLNKTIIILNQKIIMSNQIKSPVKYWGIESTERIRSLLKPVENFAASFGLQPFRIIVTKEKNDSTVDVKKKSADKLLQLVFAVRKEITKSDIDNFIDEIREAKKYSTSSLASYRKSFEDSINSKNESGSTWAEKQAYAGLDILLASSRQINSEINVDDKTDTNFYDDVLGLDKEGYRSILSAQIKFNDKDEHTSNNNAKRKAVLV